MASRCTRTGLHPEGEAGITTKSAPLASVSVFGVVDCSFQVQSTLGGRDARRAGTVRDRVVGGGMPAAPNDILVAIDPHLCECAQVLLTWSGKTEMNAQGTSGFAGGLTRAALSTCGRAESKFLSLIAWMSKTPFGSKITSFCQSERSSSVSHPAARKVSTTARALSRSVIAFATGSSPSVARSLCCSTACSTKASASSRSKPWLRWEDSRSRASRAST